MNIDFTWSDTAVLRLGPLHLKFRSASPSTVVMMALASLALYVVLFIWYADTVIAHTYPTDHTNFWFGLLHGYFAIPSFIVSWFNYHATVYQSPNDGFWYNLGFLSGIGAFARTARSSG